MPSLIDFWLKMTTNKTDKIKKIFNNFQAQVATITNLQISVNNVLLMTVMHSRNNLSTITEISCKFDEDAEIEAMDSTVLAHYVFDCCFHLYSC